MKVLIATDATAHGGVPVRIAARAQWPKDTELRILTVLEFPSWVFSVAAEPAMGVPQKEIAPPLHHAAVRLVTNAAGALQGKNRTVTCAVREGDVAEEIVAEAREWGADLILVGTHGRQRLSRYLLGSVAQRVAITAPCSVKIVRESPRLVRKGNRRPSLKILIAMDTTPHGGTAVRVAQKQEWPPSSLLRVLSVVEKAPLVRTGRQSPLPQPDAAAAKLVGEVEQAVARASATLHGKGYVVSHTIRQGVPSDEILAEASEWGADLVLLGTHGRRRLSRFLLGSVALRVASLASCAVELCRE